MKNRGITLSHNSSNFFNLDLYGIIIKGDKMKFKINNREWEIKEITKEEIIQIYEKETKQETITVSGITKFENNIIYLNKEMCYDMKKQTLMHELMHCYIKEYISLSVSPDTNPVKMIFGLPSAIFLSIST